MKIFTDIKGQSFFYKAGKNQGPNTALLSTKGLIHAKDNQIIGICSSTSPMFKSFKSGDLIKDYFLQDDEYFSKKTPG